MAGADVITNVNNNIVGAVTSVNFMNVIGWIVFIILIIAAGFYGYIWYRDKKLFNKIVTVFEIVGIHFVPSIRDTAKVVKIGTGGFEILFLKKMKIYRIGYGGRVGKDTYYFFVWKDGYWYNGMLAADINSIDAHGGLVPIVTTNPSMRSQYTSLEKQIDTLHSEKKGFMDKYGMWVVGGGFMIILGFVAFLIYKEMAPIFNNVSTITQQQSVLLDKINSLLATVKQTPVGSGGNGLVPVG